MKNVAGIDITSLEQYVAVNPEADEHSICALVALEKDFYAIADGTSMQSRYSFYGSHWYLWGKFVSCFERSPD